MGNQLLNSMVRGFGMTLGRKAANAVTRPSVEKTSTNKVSKLDREKQVQILKHKEGIKKYNEILAETEQSYKDGKISEIEFRVLKVQIDEGIADQEEIIAKLESVNTNESKSSWGWVVIAIIAIPILIGMFS